MEIKPIRLKKVFLAFLILCLASLACLTPTLATPGDYMKKFGGDVTIYTRILEMTDCTELQREVERADESLKLQEPDTQEYEATIGYRTAAENRMKEVECAGDL
ncbi:MAG TPA: hypothetical protein VFY83_02855 [Anaerolineales bacterium]|jgi:hypothetical protein|nr:hypothetical protein [Anaerolineales bacterium]